jgi:hypothetical protein
VSYGNISLKRTEVLLIERIGYQTHGSLDARLSMHIDCDNPGAFLSAVLQGIKSQVGHPGGTVDP